MIHCSSLHLDKDVNVDVRVHDDGGLSLQFMSLSLTRDPSISSYFDLHGDEKQMERVVAALEQGLMEMLRAQVNEDMATQGWEPPLDPPEVNL